MTLGPSARGRRGGRLNPGPHHRVKVVDVLRQMLGAKPMPSYSAIAARIRLRCPWSRFNYAIFQKTYLPRWRKGAL